jgi:hypothetical protein
MTGLYRSEISSGEIIRQEFNDLLNEPISEQHQRHFRKYFNGDISTKTFSIDQFGRLFQVSSILSRFNFRYLSVFIFYR